jgi:hypothetical protein
VRKRNANKAAIAFHCYVPALPPVKLVLRLLVPFYQRYISSVNWSVIQFTVGMYSHSMSAEEACFRWPLTKFEDRGKTIEKPKERGIAFLDRE